MTIRGFSRLCTITTVLALVVTGLGGLLRLSSPGVLPCAPWPACHVRVLAGGAGPGASDGVAGAPALAVTRAWQELAHVVLACLLAVLVLTISLAAWRRRARPGQQVALPLVLLGLVLLQGAAGVGSVALASEPVVVTVHLLGGLTIAALAWWLALRHGGLFTGYSRPLLGAGSAGYAPWIVAGFVVLYAQLFLGGWVSANDAADACDGFPLCQGELLPALDVQGALSLWRGAASDDSVNFMTPDARVAVHLLHRIGALLTLLYLGGLALVLLRGDHDARLKRAGGALALVLLAQIAAGIGTVLPAESMPWMVAVHTTGAGLLLLTLATVYHVARPARIAL